MKQLRLIVSALVFCMFLHTGVSKALLLEERNGKAYFDGIDITDKIDNTTATDYVHSYISRPNNPKKPNPKSILLQIIKGYLALIRANKN